MGMELTTPRCENCRFFELIGRKGVHEGECHRYPPFWRLMLEGSEAWAIPMVHPNYFCGEFQPKVEEAAKSVDPSKCMKCGVQIKEGDMYFDLRRGDGTRTIACEKCGPLSKAEQAE